MIDLGKLCTDVFGKNNQDRRSASTMLSRLPLIPTDKIVDGWRTHFLFGRDDVIAVLEEKMENPHTQDVTKERIGKILEYLNEKTED